MSNYNIRNMKDNDWKQQATVIAILDDNIGQWEFFTFPNWEKARLAVNAARSQGKAAVFYDGATPPVPPEF